MTITNNYLKKSIDEISNFISNNTDTPEDLMSDFILELKVSRLILPVQIEGDTINFPNVEADELNLLPLFSDEDELLKFSRDFEMIPNEFSFYQKLVSDLGFDGIVINCDNEGFVIDSQLIGDVEKIRDASGNSGFSQEKLKDIAFNLKNDELADFIRDDGNFRNYDDLKNLLYGSVLLCPISAEEGFGEVVERSDYGGFVLLTYKSGREDYGILFTDFDTIKESKSEYFQIANLHELFRFILTNDMDGVIVNPDTDRYYIPRNIILDMFSNDKLIDNDLASAFDYAFKI